MSGAARRASPGAQHYRRVMATFEAALAVEGVARVALLDERCAGDAALRSEVEAMLAQATPDERRTDPARSADARLQTGGGLEAMVRARPALRATTAAELDGPRAHHVLAGQYRILRVIGEGGMGIVYEAEQAIPRRNVALKAIRSAFVSQHVLRRFEQEAHILGRLHHPGIAQIYEAGSASPERGDQAFFAMELVDGLQLTQHVEKHGLDVRARIELMIKVCDAVQHAHQRGVIHRDLKPSNILVDRTGQPKVLDFGVARLEDVDSIESALQTREGQIIGTLSYMSPEQAGGDAREVDTRSDVYALGALLFELLTGQLPHPVRGRTLPQMLTVIREEDAPRVSSVMARRGGNTAKLGDDMNAIVAMALERDKRRRYSSAAELGADLQRFLAGEPILAKQDSAIYVLKKQIHRHRYAAAMVALVVLGLVAFAVFYKHRADREQLAKQQALDALREADAQHQRADENARELAAALHASNLERGRLMGASGHLRGAEDLMWDEYLGHPSLLAHWALWDLYSRFPCLLTFGGQTDSVLALDLSADGDFVATCSHDGFVRVWDLAHGKCTATLGQQDGLVMSVAFGPGSDRIWSAASDGAIKAWDVAQRKELWSLRTESGELLAMACAPSGTVAAVTSRDGPVRIVDLANARFARDLAPESKGGACLCFDATGRQLATGGQDGIVHTWDVQSGAELAAWPGRAKAIQAVALSPDGRTLAVGSSDSSVRLWNVASRQCEATLTEENGGVRWLSFARSGDLLLVTGNTRTDVWDVASRTRRSTGEQIEQPSLAAHFSPDARRIIAGASGGLVRVWEIDPRGAQTSIRLPVEPPHLIALSRDGRFAGSGGGDGVVTVWNASDGSEVARFAAHAVSVHTLAFDTEGTRTVSTGLDNVVKVTAVRDGSPVFTLDPQPSYIDSARFSPDGRIIACALGNGLIRVFDAASGALLRELSADLGEAQRLNFSSDGKLLASTHRGRAVEVWNIEAGARIAHLEAPGATWSIAFVPSSTLLVVGTWTGELEVWDTQQKQLVRTLAGHSQRVNGLSIASRSLIASASSDGTVKLWDADSDLCLATLDARAGAAENILISADGRTLTSVHADGTLRRWDLGWFDRHIDGNAEYQTARRAKAALDPGSARR